MNSKKQIVKRREGSEGGGTNWAVFPARYSNERIMKFLDHHVRWAIRTDIWGSAYTIHSQGEYNGAGQSYVDGPCFYRRGSRVVVTQDFGLDI